MAKPQQFPAGTNSSQTFSSLLILNCNHNISLVMVLLRYPFSINPTIHPSVPLFLCDNISLYSHYHTDVLHMEKILPLTVTKINWPEIRVKWKHCILICCLLERQQKAFIWSKVLRTDIIHSPVNIWCWKCGAEGFQRANFWVLYKTAMLAMYCSVTGNLVMLARGMTVQVSRCLYSLIYFRRLVGNKSKGTYRINLSLLSNIAERLTFLAL